MLHDTVEAGTGVQVKLLWSVPFARVKRKQVYFSGMTVLLQVQHRNCAMPCKATLCCWLLFLSQHGEHKCYVAH